MNETKIDAITHIIETIDLELGKESVITMQNHIIRRKKWYNNSSLIRQEYLLQRKKINEEKLKKLKNGNITSNLRFVYI